jgi:hypothetical protein
MDEGRMDDWEERSRSRGTVRVTASDSGSERVSIKKLSSIVSGIGLEASTSVGCLFLPSVSNFLPSWIPD